MQRDEKWGDIPSVMFYFVGVERRREGERRRGGGEENEGKR